MLVIIGIWRVSWPPLDVLCCKRTIISSLHKWYFIFKWIWSLHLDRCIQYIRRKLFCFTVSFERDLFTMKPLIDGFFTDTTNLRIKFLFHAETLYSSSILKFCYAFTTSKYLIYNGKNFFSKKNYYIQTRIAHSWLIYLKRV